MTDIHLGQRLYELIIQHRYTVEEYAEKTGKTKSALYLAFKKKDINTSLIRTAVKILGISIFDIFEPNPYIIKEEVNAFGEPYPVRYKRKSNPNAPISVDQSTEIQLLNERIESLKEQNRLLKEMNEILKSRDK